MREQLAHKRKKYCRFTREFLLTWAMSLYLVVLQLHMQSWRRRIGLFCSVCSYQLCTFYCCFCAALSESTEDLQICTALQVHLLLATYYSFSRHHQVTYLSHNQQMMRQRQFCITLLYVCVSSFHVPYRLSI